MTAAAAGFRLGRAIVFGIWATMAILGTMTEADAGTPSANANGFNIVCRRA